MGFFSKLVDDWLNIDPPKAPPPPKPVVTPKPKAFVNPSDLQSDTPGSIRKRTRRALRINLNPTGAPNSTSTGLNVPSA